MLIVSPLIRLALKIASIVLFVITLAAAYGGYVNPQYMTVPSVMVLALPYLAILTLVAGIAWLCSGRIIMAALAGLTLFASWSSLRDVTPIAFSKSADEGARTFKLITFNCLHFADTTKSDLPGNRAIEFLIKSDADIVCLQEMLDLEDPTEIHHWDRALIDSLYAAYPYRAGKKGQDLKILSKFPVKAKDIDIKTARPDYWNRSGRWQLFEVNIYGFKLPIVDFHMNSYELTDTERGVVSDISGVRTAKNSYQEFRKEIFPKLGVAFRTRAVMVDEMAQSTAGIDPIIACGDFNDVAASWSYRIMRKAGFQDAYSETNFGPTNTFNQFLLLFHIDQIFYRGPQLKCLDVRRLKLNTSDHYPLEATFQLTPASPVSSE